jgi:very-short-patch-repair endonuclease
VAIWIVNPEQHKISSILAQTKKAMSRKEDNLHHKAVKRIFDFARQNRQKQTQAEALLWRHLRNRQVIGQKVRRQHPIGNFIADFYIHQFKLVIELDGDYHFRQDQREHDQGRSFELEELGIKILRFTNNEVIQDLNAVLETIKKHLTLNPSPQGEGLYSLNSLLLEEKGRG